MIVNVGATVETIKNNLASTLNSNVLSTDSIYGIIILAVIVWSIIGFIRKTLSSPIRLIGFLLLLEFGHMFAFNTGFGSQFPVLKTIFKFDVLTSLAQLFVGTPVADWLLWLQAVINALAIRVWSVSSYYLGHIFTFLRGALR